MVPTLCHSLRSWLSLFDPPLLALAALVCAGGSYTVFFCLGRAVLAAGRLRWSWLGAICVCFGAVASATDFIARLAYLPALPAGYHLDAAIGSVLIATAGGAIPFGYLILRPRARFSAGLAGICLGLTIAFTHFAGLGAATADGRVAGSLAYTFAGLALAMALSGFAIAEARHRRRRYRLGLSSLSLMLAIFGFHCFAIAGSSLGLGMPPAGHALDPRLLASLVDAESLALAVASVSGVVLVAALCAAIADRRIGVLQAQDAEELHRQMRNDATTSLPNRLFFRERLAAAIAAADRPRNFALLIVDLDRFKRANDLYGREAGDRLLREAALRMRKLIGAADVAARIGGDKFGILQYAEALPAGGFALADRVIRALEEPFAVDQHLVAIGASIGFAICPPEGAVAESLLQDAETALQHARREGGGKACLFKAEMRHRREVRRQMEHDFRRAIAERQFVMHYQPLFHAETLDLSGFEALLRWEHPEHGMISPTQFIPFAEKSGLIAGLGLWALEAACAEAAHWPDHVGISINISPVQLNSGDLVTVIGAVLQKTGLPARRLELEVTETALIENPEQVREILSRLREMGVRVTIDDFGTGYSSLSYLRDFPFDRIKIDRSFIQNLEGDSDALAIVRAIITLGHSLRVSVLAEGIETAGQLQLLRKQGCDLLQGFLLGTPAPGAEATGLVETYARTVAQRFARSSGEQKVIQRQL